jgi:hypothetical protein
VDEERERIEAARSAVVNSLVRCKENQSMRWIARVFLVMVVGVLSGCAVGQPGGYVDASAWSANYTEDYIQDFWIQSADGKKTGLGGIQVKEFSKGGTGKRQCCSLIPGVGQTIKVVWRVGGRQDDKSKWTTYSRDVVVKGEISKNSARHSYLIVRFFPAHEVEAEFVPGDDPRGARNPRVDQLFLGQRVMRHMEE